MNQFYPLPPPPSPLRQRLPSFTSTYLQILPGLITFLHLMGALLSRFSAREAKGIFNGNPSRVRRDLLRSGDGRHCSSTMEQETKAMET